MGSTRTFGDHRWGDRSIHRTGGWEVEGVVNRGMIGAPSGAQSWANDCGWWRRHQASAERNTDDGGQGRRHVVYDPGKADERQMHRHRWVYFIPPNSGEDNNNRNHVWKGGANHFNSDDLRKA